MTYFPPRLRGSRGVTRERGFSTPPNNDDTENSFLVPASGTWPDTRPGATAHVPTSWVEVVASTPEPYSGLELRVTYRPGNPGSVSRCAYDIALGGSGSEVIWAEGLVCSSGPYNSWTRHIIIPKAVPAGARVSIRAQLSLPYWSSEAPAGTLNINGLRGGTTPLGGPYARHAIYGWDRTTTNSNGPEFTGYADVGYKELVAAAPFRVRAMGIIAVHSTAVGWQGTETWYDVGVGAGGAEAMLVPRRSVAWGDADFFPVDIAEGTRIALRCWYMREMRVITHLFG